VRSGWVSWAAAFPVQDSSARPTSWRPIARSNARIVFFPAGKPNRLQSLVDAIAGGAFGRLESGLEITRISETTKN